MTEQAVNNVILSAIGVVGVGTLFYIIMRQCTDLRSSPDCIENHYQGEIEDMPTENEELNRIPSNGKKYYLELFKGKKGSYFHLRHRNGNIIMHSETYSSRGKALQSMNALAKCLKDY